MHLIGFRFDYSTRDKVCLARRLLCILRSLLCIIGRRMVFSDRTRRSNFWTAFEQILDRLRDVTLPYWTDGHTQSNLRTSLRSSVYSVYYRTGRCRIKGVLQRPAVKDISRKSLCELFFYTYMHAYILVLMCCKCCRCRKSHATHEMSCHNRCQMFNSNASWRQAPRRSLNFAHDINLRGWRFAITQVIYIGLRTC